MLKEDCEIRGTHMDTNLTQDIVPHIFITDKYIKHRNAQFVTYNILVI